MAYWTRGETERVIKWKAQAGLTDLVFPFHGEFHQQLLGVGANEDEWRGGLVADVRILQRERERNNEAGSGRKGFSSVVIDRKHAAEFEIDWHFHEKGDIYLICRGSAVGHLISSPLSDGAVIASRQSGNTTPLIPPPPVVSKKGAEKMVQGFYLHYSCCSCSCDGFL